MERSASNMVDMLGNQGDKPLCSMLIHTLLVSTVLKSHVVRDRAMQVGTVLGIIYQIQSSTYWRSFFI